MLPRAGLLLGGVETSFVPVTAQRAIRSYAASLLGRFVGETGREIAAVPPRASGTSPSAW